MPTPPLPESARTEILETAPYCSRRKDIAQKLDLAESTLRSRIISFGISDEVAALLGTAKFSSRLESVVPKAPSHSQTGVSETPVSAPPVPQIVGAGPDVTPNIEQIRKSAEAHYAMKAKRAEEKRHQSIRFPYGPVAFFFVGDQHIGNAGTDVGRMFEEQELIMSTPGSYVFQMGDIVDNFIIGRLVAENWKQSLPVWEQWHLAKHYLAGFKDKLVAVNGGNHDFWTHKVSGIDYTRDVSPPGVLYDADEIRTSVHVGPHEFKLWTRHKWRGSSIYNATHGQERAARFDDPNFDIYVGAHIHKGAMAREFVHDASRRIAMLIGTYKATDDYATSEGFPRNDASTACALILHGDGSFHAMSDLRAALSFMRAVYR